ncbi:MAG TPA: cytochrome c [Anaerolineales bacterium]|nr:cytochrome c [Anaerolineales bacterium]HRF47159.1 cytochrome c [Anaerolineales bacterium]
MSRPVSLAVLLLALVLVGCTSAGGTGGDATGDAARGEALFKQSTIGTASAPGCSTCHSLDGSTLVGPTQTGVVGRAEAAISSADYKGIAKTVEEYLKESIVTPDAFVEQGFTAGVMYQNFGKELSDQEVADLVAFLMTQK